MNSILQWMWQVGRRAGARGSDGIPPPPPRPPLAPGEEAALASAREWLDAATLAHARIFALGEELRFDVDQDIGRLTLQHADGFKVALADIQLLGSFRPQDASFRWSWGNSSVAERLTEAARQVREHPTTASFASLRAPTFEMKSKNDYVGLVALAAKLGGYDGVYRGITDNHLSVFIAYKLPSAAGVFQSRPTPAAEAEAIAIIDRYDADMLPIDEEHIARPRGMTVSEETKFDERLLDKKLEVYRRYWTRSDRVWEPISFSDPSEHAPWQKLRRFSLPRRDGGVYVITQRPTAQDVYVFHQIDGKLRITDMDLNWGRGLMLIDPAIKA